MAVTTPTRRSLPGVVPLLVLLLAAVPAAGKEKRDRKKGAGAALNLVWPLPPDPPRVRYLQSHRGEWDYRKKPSRWKRFLLGPENETAISLAKPYGVATDANGRVYVTDSVRGAVLVFDPEARQVTPLGEDGQVKLSTPIGIAIDPQGRIFVSDTDLDHVYCFLPDGRIVMGLGKEPGLRNPTGLAIDPERRRLYVADSHLHQVILYSLDGEYLASWGERGSAEGQFNFPTNLALDREGNLYVVDTGNFRVQALGPDGRFLSTFGQAGDSLGEFTRPKGIAIDSEGHIYVADAAFNNFQIFNRDGQLLLYVGTIGRNPGNFWLPAGMHIDGEDRIFVVDQGNARVQVFQYMKEDGPGVQ